MWVYRQSTGELLRDGMVVAKGYAGAPGEGKNNPAMEHVPNVGPIPKGLYTLGKAINHKKIGPVAIPLTPDPANEMYGRSAFYVHGDSIRRPGTASEGCIILGRSVRDQMCAETNKELRVIE